MLRFGERKIKMTSIAILGFGVVGGGVADLIIHNSKEVNHHGGDDINIKYVLDLRDFPDSPLADRVVHDYSVILSDPDVSVVIEVMGGSHPAYEYTVAALKAGKSVITSNKEVVANFGDEFLALARENGVCYRFEAAVGGGIPVISPMLSCVGQNKISEVRGILNGTTNYILTQMFTYGRSFESALKDAQEKGYAERNPDADILGTDACRKIAILTSLITGALIPTELIHTEGITKIRDNDVRAAEAVGCTIKLVGRGFAGEKPFCTVAPFLVPSDMPLSGVSGVYNAVEIIAEPLGNIMLYGQGAGAGATASAVVGDLMQVMRMGTGCYAPVLNKCTDIADYDGFASRFYIAADKAYSDIVLEAFPSAVVIPSESECAIITESMSERELSDRLSAIGVTPLSKIRVL
ncbi:MAG: homoserine dehydrogenase [Ruminococcaceae bacterium]|nr:homoserine dehydrogenase [Oscillospiraceae bacterium]